MIKEAIAQVVEGQNLPEGVMVEVMHQIMGERRPRPRSHPLLPLCV